MAWDTCRDCGWEIAEPGLGEVISGAAECTNCGLPRALTSEERVEVGHDIEQRLHFLEQAMWPLSK